MNHYERFNDPFECRNEVLKGFPNKDENSPRISGIIKAWGFDDELDPSALESYEDLVLSLEDTEPNVPLTIDSARISCFSKNSNNLLMWAHYANGLRGFCVEFDEDEILPDDVDAGIFEVLYEDKPPFIDTAIIAVLNDQANYHEDAIYETEERLKYAVLDSETEESANSEVQMYKEYLNLVYLKNREIYQKMLATKSIEWQYEEELRIILQTENINNNEVFLKYPVKSIKCIIVGEKMSISQRETLKKIVQLKSFDIKFKIATRVPGRFEVIVHDLIE